MATIRVLVIAFLAATFPLRAQVYHDLVEGPVPGEGFGLSLADVGDIDGDGAGDLLVGAQGSLPSPPPVRLVSGATGDITLEIPAGPWYYFGRGLDAAGDQDLDGVIDLAVGAPLHVVFPDQPCHVFVFSGADGGELLHIRYVDWTSDFGSAVSGAQDFDEDGVHDLLIGASWEDVGLVDQGRLHLRSGVDGSPLFSPVAGATAGAKLGTSVAACGDLSGDGMPDILAGAPGADSVEVRSGRSFQLIYSITGAAASSFGWAVEPLGDLDLDGTPDFAVGMPNASTGNGGGVSVRSGATGAELYQVSAPFPAPQSFGRSVARVGDVTGDGFADFLAGGAYGTSLTGEGQAALYDGADGTQLHAWQASAGCKDLGLCVAGPGDLDGDHVPDIALSRPELCGSGLPGGLTLIGGIPGDFVTYGAGVAGSGGFVPALQGEGDLGTGGTYTVRVVDGYATAHGVLYYGREAAALPFASGTLWLEPLVSVPHVLHQKVGTATLVGTGIFSWESNLPVDPALVGIVFYLQAAYHDTAAPSGTSLTAGLEAHIGS